MFYPWLVRVSLAIFLSTAFMVGVSGETKINLTPESKIWIDGNSTVHPYTLTSTSFEVSCLLKGKTSLKATNVASFTLTLPVKSLHSKDADLDKNAYGALKATEFPTIQFSLSRVEIIQPLQEDTVMLQVHGLLTIAGVTKPITVSAKGKVQEETGRFQGSETLLMTDFGITPPELFWGAIKVDNKIVVNFDLRFEIDHTKKGDPS